MATSYGAICTDFYVNLTLSVKMDLPEDRGMVMEFCDRVRNDLPDMSRFQRFEDELALESRRHEGEYRWLALRQNCVRCGHVNPESFDDAYRLHRLILQLAPFYLSINPLDLDSLELTFGFDLECKANHHQIVHEALLGGSPLGGLLDYAGASPIDVQPALGMMISGPPELHAFVEVKTRTPARHVRRGRYRSEPISVFVTMRHMGSLESVDQLPTLFESMHEQLDALAQEKVVGELLMPISRAILNSP